MEFGDRLRILREKHEYTQEDVAKYLKTTQSYYAQYESDIRPITFERAIMLSKLYGVSLDYIGGLSDDINKRPE